LLQERGKAARRVAGAAGPRKQSDATLRVRPSAALNCVGHVPLRRAGVFVAGL
jgi:hypothetical protein